MKRVNCLVVLGVLVALAFGAYFLTSRLSNLFKPPTIYLFRDIGELATSRQMLYIEPGQKNPKGVVCWEPLVWPWVDKSLYVMYRGQIFSAKFEKYLFVENEKKMAFLLPDKRTAVYPLGIWDGKSLYYKDVVWLSVQDVTNGSINPPSQKVCWVSTGGAPGECWSRFAKSLSLPQYTALRLSSYFDTRSNKIFFINFDLVDQEGEVGIVVNLVTEVDLLPLPEEVDPSSIKWEETKQTTWRVGTTEK